MIVIDSNKINTINELKNEYSRIDIPSGKELLMLFFTMEDLETESGSTIPIMEGELIEDGVYYLDPSNENYLYVTENKSITNVNLYFEELKTDENKPLNGTLLTYIYMVDSSYNSNNLNSNNLNSNNLNSNNVYREGGYQGGRYQGGRNQGTMINGGSTGTDLGYSSFYNNLGPQSHNIPHTKFSMEELEKLIDLKSAWNNHLNEKNSSDKNKNREGDLSSIEEEVVNNSYNNEYNNVNTPSSYENSNIPQDTTVNNNNNIGSRLGGYDLDRNELEALLGNMVKEKSGNVNLSDISDSLKASVSFSSEGNVEEHKLANTINIHAPNLYVQGGRTSDVHDYVSLDPSLPVPM